MGLGIETVGPGCRFFLLSMQDFEFGLLGRVWAFKV